MAQTKCSVSRNLPSNVHQSRLEGSDMSALCIASLFRLAPLWKCDDVLSLQSGIRAYSVKISFDCWKQCKTKRFANVRSRTRLFARLDKNSSLEIVAFTILLCPRGYTDESNGDVYKTKQGSLLPLWNEQRETKDIINAISKLVRSTCVKYMRRTLYGFRLHAANRLIRLIQALYEFRPH